MRITASRVLLFVAVVVGLVLGAFIPAAMGAATGISTQQIRTASPNAVTNGAAASEGTSLAVARADHVHSTSGFTQPGSCSAGQYQTADVSGAGPTCAQVQTNQLGGTITDAQLANNYSGIGSCSAGDFVTGLNDNGAPTCATPPGGGSGAPTNGEYVTYSANATLSAERVLTAGVNTVLSTAVAGQIIFDVLTGPTFSGDVTAANFVTAGNVTLNGTISDSSGAVNVADSLVLTSNGSTLQLVGTDHTYVEFYPDGAGAGRKAYLGYGSAGDDSFYINNEISNEAIRLLTTGASSSIRLAADGSTRLQVNPGSISTTVATNVNGKLTVTSDGQTAIMAGTSSTYLQFFPDTTGGAANGYIGFADAANDQMTVKNNTTGQELNLFTTGTGQVRIRSGSSAAEVRVTNSAVESTIPLNVSTGTNTPIVVTTSSASPWAFQHTRSDLASTASFFYDGTSWYFNKPLSVSGAAVLSGTVGIGSGGTGNTTAVAAFDALAPTNTTGDLVYFDGTDNARLGIGKQGAQLTVIHGGSDVPVWSEADGFAAGRRVAMTCFINAPNATAYSCNGASAPGVTAAGTASPQANRMYLSWTTGTVSGNNSGHSGPGTWTRPGWRPVMSGYFRTQATISLRRQWHALTESNINALAVRTEGSGAAASSIDFVGIAWDTAVSGNFACCSGDGTNYSCKDTGLAVSASTEYFYQLDWDTAGTLNCTLNTTTVAKTTNLSTASVNIGPQLNVTTLSAAAVVAEWGTFEVQHN